LKTFFHTLPPLLNGMVYPAFARFEFAFHKAPRELVAFRREPFNQFTDFRFPGRGGIDDAFLLLEFSLSACQLGTKHSNSHTAGGICGMLLITR
jgi:hypothetical protein